jgi:hypothetical protein
MLAICSPTSGGSSRLIDCQTRYAMQCTGYQMPIALQLYPIACYANYHVSYYYYLYHLLPLLPSLATLASPSTVRPLSS